MHVHVHRTSKIQYAHTVLLCKRGPGTQNPLYRAFSRIADVRTVRTRFGPSEGFFGRVPMEGKERGSRPYFGSCTDDSFSFKLYRERLAGIQFLYGQLLVASANAMSKRFPLIYFFFFLLFENVHT